MKNMKVRIPMYFVGLFIMTIGIALSVKSNLGVSPEIGRASCRERV